jgi:type IV pilus assembly protein PilQ
MPDLLRITLLTVSLAVGIAVALAIALAQPPMEQAPQQQEPPPVGERRVPPPPIEPALAPYREPIARQMGRLEEAILQIEEASHRRERSLLRAISAVQEQLDERPSAEAPPPPMPVPPPVQELPPPADTVRRGEGDDQLNINIQNSDIRSVLEMLSQEAGLNIVASRSVTGAVTANLIGVDVETALAAILKSTGFVAHREGSIIYVGTPQDLAAMQQAQDQVLTRVYRPNYIRAADLQTLITPMLTPSVGRCTVSNPSEIDIPSDQNRTGGNSFAGTDVVVVRDYAAVLAEIDQIFEEVDIKPRQVAIEAMILSVKLSDTYKLGVNFEALLGNSNARLVSGFPPATLSSIALDGGLKFGFLDSNLALFIEALEKVGDTNVIAAPRLTCLNKQRAEIQIGEELGYVSTTVTETSATQTVNFLDVGTLLRIRPYIDNNGLIRLEVHPELSTGTVEVQQGMSLPQKSVTQVTTNVLCPDGCTVVIGGLIREDLTTTTTQIPVLGNLPWVGPVFRQKTNTVDRNEIIVLITPRIVSEPFMCQEGAKYGNDYTQRQAIYFDKMSPVAKRNLGVHHLRMARAAFAAGDFATAMKQVNLAIHYDPQRRDAVVLRNEILAAGGFEDESIHEYLHWGLPPLSGRHRDYSRLGYPWKEFEGFGPPEIAASEDLGPSGPVRTLQRPLPGLPAPDWP